MALKTYVSIRKPNLSVSYQVPGLAAGTEKTETAFFQRGILATEDLAEQAAIEKLDDFKAGLITIKSPESDLVAARAKAKGLRETANAAEADAVAAEAAVKALEKSLAEPSSEPAK